jgi:hypothetical protein
MKRVVVAAVLLVAGLSPLAARTSGQQPEGYPAAGEPAIVKLISAGAAPRSALRYAVPADAKEHMDMTLNMSMSMDMGGMSMPAMTVPGMKIGADVAVTSLSPAGDLTYTMGFTGVTVEAGADPAMAAQMQGMSDFMKTVTGSVTLSNRGVVRTANLDLGKLANSEFAQILGSTSETLKNVATPFPEEEVGVGARWEVRLALEAAGVKMYQKTEFELVAFDGKTATLKTKTEQTAPPQSISNPAMPSGAAIQLQKMTGAGSGTMVVRLNGLVPTSNANVESTMVMLVDLAGSTQQMSATTSMKLSVAPGK